VIIAADFISVHSFGKKITSKEIQKKEIYSKFSLFAKR